MCKVTRRHLRLRKGQVSFKLSSTIWAFKAEKGSDFIAAHQPIIRPASNKLPKIRCHLPSVVAAMKPLLELLLMVALSFPFVPSQLGSL